MSENKSELSPRQKLAKEKRLLQAETKLRLNVMELEAELVKAKKALAAKRQEIEQLGIRDGSN